MSTTATLPDRVLSETLSKLESALLVPPIAGEMGNWVHEVKQAAATLATDWTREQNCVLHPQYEQIAQTDPEMLSHVQQLTESDKALAAELVHFHEQLHNLEEATSHVDWQESKLSAQQERVEHDGLQLLLHMKKQLATAGTMLTEAVYRDRGVKD
jgi:hypothetical protein